MNRIMESVILFVAIFLMLLGVVFLIAAGTQNLITGGALVLMAIVLMVFVYRSFYSMRIEGAELK